LTHRAPSSRRGGQSPWCPRYDPEDRVPTACLARRSGNWV
jgi:hypothetical protein